MRHAFITSVPVTLIEAIHFAYTYDLDADVYITKSFNDAENIAERLKETNIFKNVYLTENVLMEYPITIEQCLKIVKYGRNLVRELKDRHYDYGYYNNSGWLINSIFYTGFLKGNKECVQRFIEHGYNTLMNSYGDKPAYMRALVNLFGFKCMDGSMLEALYLFEPDLLQVKQDGELRRMPKMNGADPKFKEIVNTAFDYNPETNEFSDKSLIIMEQGPQKVEFDKEKFWEDILESIDISNAIIKPHPRQKESSLAKFGIPVSKNHTMPWEVIAMNTDMDNKTQLSMFCSSCLLPKYAFDMESRVVLLYKLLPVDYTFLGKDILKFSNGVEELYEDKNKFFVPNDLNEFKNYMKAF